MTVLGDGTVVTGGTEGVVGFETAKRELPPTPARKTRHAGKIRGLAATGDTPRTARSHRLPATKTSSSLEPSHGRAGADADPGRGHADVGRVGFRQPAGRYYRRAGWRNHAFDDSADKLPPVAKQVQGWNDVAAVAMSPSGDRLAAVRTQDSGGMPLTQMVLSDPTSPTRMIQPSVSAAWSSNSPSPPTAAVSWQVRIPDPWPSGTARPADATSTTVARQ